MELVNETRMTVGYNVGLEPNGRELLVLVVKGTFVLPRPGESVRLHEQQSPLTLADTFTGEPGTSAPLREIDFAPRKRMCDVLLIGSAHAPAGTAVSRMRVRLRVDTIDKSIDVVGDRVWQAGLLGVGMSAPRPFERMFLSYDRAYGGMDPACDQQRSYAANPVGRGWHRHLKDAQLDGRPLPNLEEPGRAVRTPRDDATPTALGPVGRAWPERAGYAGTYDQAWLDRRFPFLPEDFDDRYYQAAPSDQQLPIPGNALQVALDGFTPDGPRHFALPQFHAPVQIEPRRGPTEVHAGRLDTIVFEPDEARFTMTWRVTRPLRRSVFDIRRARVGTGGRERWSSPGRYRVAAASAVA